MKSGKYNNKIIVSCFILASALFLFGFGSNKAELRNCDSPFINLTGSVGNSVTYAENAINAESATTAPAVVTPVVITPKPSNEVLIRVHNEEICVITVINGNDSVRHTYEDLNGLKTDIENGIFDEKTVILIDDYAESVTFNRIIKLFKDLKSIDPEIRTR